MAEEKKVDEKGPVVMSYRAADGQEVKLTLDVVKKYLVHGKPELVTTQELVYFMHICRARGLNPFTKDCYLIKYDESPAAIVTSIDFFRRRAKAQPDCQGWHIGLIAKRPDGGTRKTHGFLPESDQLLGAWFEAQPKGWAQPFYKEINLKGYVKTKRDGQVTKFWAEENQAEMIMKVAESQGLRRLWPDEFHGIYEESEIPGPASGIISLPEPEAAAAVDIEAEFEKNIPPDTDRAKLTQFIARAASASQKTELEIKKAALDDQDRFWNGFAKFLAKPVPKKKCPETEKEFIPENCELCLFKKGCPALD